MAQKMKIPLSEVENLLKDYGTKVSVDGEEPELYRLADNRYKDLRVWEWKYSPTLRTQVIAAASKAFDSLEIPKDHVYRRNLIDPRIKKAEAEAAAAEKDAQRRAAAEIEAAEKAAAEKLAFEKITEQAKAAKQAGAQVRRQVSNPTSMLQKVAKIGTTNGPKRRSPSVSSDSFQPFSPTSSPKLSSTNSASGVAANRKSPVGADGDSPIPSSAPITSKTRKRLHPPAAGSSARGTTSTGTPASRSSSFETVQQNSPASSSTNSPPSPPASTASSLLNPRKRKLPASSTPDVTIRNAKRSASETAKSSASTTSVPSTLPSPPKPGTAGPDEDMFALAQMFREKYSVYEKLYRKISKSNNVVTASATAFYREAAGDDERQNEKVRKLVSLHRELEQVKKRLWAMSPPGSSSTVASSRTNGNLRKSSVKNKSR
ncbi:hypothetical protein D0Z03_002566 [Geotrichum reessii]|nr:hypothetical protein D0Z03_002566 [Galactomyces reessii]